VEGLISLGLLIAMRSVIVVIASLMVVISKRAGGSWSCLGPELKFRASIYKAGLNRLTDTETELPQ
jgi:hypothetical protein